MRQIVLPLSALLLSSAVVLVGNGLQGVLIPVRARIEDFSDVSIGALTSLYYAGLLIGCLIGPLVIRRAGHIRAFTAFTAIAVAAPLLHAIFPLPATWFALRLVSGICFAGLTMGIESWLNAIAAPESRGRILSTYVVINFTVITVGQQFMNLADPAGFELFSLVAILISLAAVPLALTRSIAPEPPQTVKLNVGWLFSVSPAGVGGCLAAGLLSGAFWGFAPVAVMAAGLPVSAVALFMSAAVLGGAAVQWPLGWLSDHKGRRLVLILTALMAGGAGALLYLAGGESEAAMLALAVVYGAGVLPLYPLSVAHANDFVEREDAVRTSSGLLLVFSSGAIAGPVLASFAIRAFGPPAMFAFTSVVALLFIGFVFWRRSVRPGRPPKATWRRFIPFPSTSPAVFRLRPRNRHAHSGGGEPHAEPVRA
jgi:MFS family permease